MTMPRMRFHLLKVGHCTHPECVAMRGGSWSPMLFPALCGLLLHPKRGWMLFDTGYSQHFTTATETFPERLYRWTTPFNLPVEEALPVQLKRAGISPGDIDHVIISHMHGDHIAGLKDFPNARFVTLRKELDTVRSRSKFENLRHGVLPGLLPPDFQNRIDYADDVAQIRLPSELRPFEKGADLFGDGSLLTVHLPGHSSGQIGIVFRQEDEQIVFMAADACWSLSALRENRPPTWLARRIFDRSDQYQDTFRRLQQLSSQAQAPWLIPSHCAQTWADYGNKII